MGQRIRTYLQADKKNVCAPVDSEPVAALPIGVKAYNVTLVKACCSHELSPLPVQNVKFTTAAKCELHRVPLIASP